MGGTFKVKIDQQSLKHLLEQRVATLIQQKWVSKLLDYDFVAEYKKRAENQVADALSRKGQEDEETLMLISFPTVDWLDDLKVVYTTDPKVKSLISLFKESKLSPEYAMRAYLLLYNQCLYIP